MREHYGISKFYSIILGFWGENSELNWLICVYCFVISV